MTRTMAGIRRKGAAATMSTSERVAMRGEFETFTIREGITPIALNCYPDGMPLLGFPYRSEIERLMLRPHSFGAFFSALFWVDALAARGNAVPELILPNVPGARQDRLNASGDYLFTLRSVAQAINARKFPQVTVIDPHSDAAPALIERCRIVSAADCINPPANKYAAVVSPDGGAEKRTGAVARKLGVPMVHAWKSRDVTTGKISGFGLEHAADVPVGSLALVVDDICDGGGTFLGLADCLDAAGLKAHLWTTHGLYTQGTSELLKRYGHLYCTDSTLAGRVGVIEVDICTRLLKGNL